MRREIKIRKNRLGRRFVLWMVLLARSMRVVSQIERVIRGVLRESIIRKGDCKENAVKGLNIRIKEKKDILNKEGIARIQKLKDKAGRRSKEERVNRRVSIC